MCVDYTKFRNCKHIKTFSAAAYSPVWTEYKKFVWEYFIVQCRMLYAALSYEKLEVYIYTNRISCLLSQYK